MNYLKPVGRNCGTTGQRRARPWIVIEHLEERESKWLLAEYRHAISIAGDSLVITNAPPSLCARLGLDRDVNCYTRSIEELEGELYSSKDKLIVLDPQALLPLRPREAKTAEAIVIGGILGDNPPRGRTRELLTKRLAPPAIVRHIGEYQLSIDGAVYVAYNVAKGRRLSDISLVVNPVVTIDSFFGELEILLPYAYPLVLGRPLISKELIDLLKKGAGYEYYEEFWSQTP